MEVAKLKEEERVKASQAPAAEPSPLPLMIIGSLWVLLAASIFIYQLARPAQIEIEWVTETEFDTAGFNIYRAEARDAEYVQLNPNLISSAAIDPTSGASYSFVDSDVTSGLVYYYVLEDVELNGNLIRHEEDIIAGEFTRFEWWALVSVPISFLVGLLLLFTGITRLRNRAGKAAKL